MVPFSHYSITFRRLSLLISALAVIIACALFTRYYDLASMWVEGPFEFETLTLKFFNLYNGQPDGFWINIGNFYFPVARAPYIGILDVMLYLPSAFIYLVMNFGDVYLYRFTGLILLIVCGLLVARLLAEFLDRRIALLSGAVYITTPNVFIVAITDRQLFLVHTLCFLFILATTARFLKTGRIFHWYLTCFAIGFALNSRLDAILWSIIPMTASLLLFGLIHRDRFYGFWTRPATLANIVCITIISAGCFLIGGLPFIIYYIEYASYVTSWYQHLFDRSPVSTLSNSLTLRLEQILHFNILSQFRMYGASYSNILYGLCFFFGVAILGKQTLRQGMRGLTFTTITLLTFLLMIPVLSLATPAGLREEHLILFQAAILAFIALGLNWVVRYKRSLVAGALGSTLLLANLTIITLTLRDVESSAKRSITFATANAPDSIVDYASRYCSNCDLLFTAFSARPYVHYFSKGRWNGMDEFPWSGIDNFKAILTRDLLAEATQGRRVLIVAGIPPVPWSAEATIDRAIQDVIRENNLQSVSDSITNRFGIPVYKVFRVAPVGQRADWPS